jgi:predicted CopG family antitoxin
MAVKTLTVTEEAYRRLRAQKGDSESFSEVIVRLTSKVPLSSYAGGISTESAQRLHRAIERDRRKRAKLDLEHAARN